MLIHRERGKKTHFNTHCINAGELHADVDHRNGDKLPADATVREQAANRDCLDRGQGPQLLLHLLDLRLDVSLIAVPLQGCKSGAKRGRGS